MLLYFYVIPAVHPIHNVIFTCIRLLTTFYFPLSFCLFSYKKNVCKTTLLNKRVCFFKEYSTQSTLKRHFAWPVNRVCTVWRSRRVRGNNHDDRTCERRHHGKWRIRCFYRLTHLETSRHVLPFSRSVFPLCISNFYSPKHQWYDWIVTN